MSKKLFIGGLDWNTSDESLRQAFEVFGEVTEAKVVLDRETNRSRGFGFVTFSDTGAAAEAITGMDGKSLDGRSVRVNEAQDSQRGRGGRGFAGRTDDRGRRGR